MEKRLATEPGIGIFRRPYVKDAEMASEEILKLMSVYQSGVRERAKARAAN